MVGILILLVLAVGLFRYTRQTKRTVIVDVAKVRADVGAHLPLGSSRATVEKFLNEKGIPHSYIEKAPGSIGYDRTEMALIRESSHSGFIRGDIQLMFRFDVNDRLIQSSVQEIFTGP